MDDWKLKAKTVVKVDIEPDMFVSSCCVLIEDL